MGVIGYYIPSVDDACRWLKSCGERDAKIAARQRYAEANGLHVCDKCGGEGGRSEWPGWTCFECGGAGFVKVA